MRFYQQSGRHRLSSVPLWVLVALFWLYALRHDHQGWGTLQKVIWITLTVIQMISMWTYWELTPAELRHQPPIGPGRTFPLRDLLYAGDVRRSGWIGHQLKNSIEVQFAGKPTLYVSVKERDRFRTDSTERSLPKPEPRL